MASGRVRFVPMSEYRGEDGDGHHVVSLLNGAQTTVKVRRKFVDATYVESEIPSRHTPSFEIDEGVRFMPPNGLVHIREPRADSRSSAPARRRWTRAAGSSTPESHPTRSGGSSLATGGCSTARSCNRSSSWVVVHAAPGAVGQRGRARRRTRPTSRTGSRRVACSCASTRPSSQRCSAARP